ncbi:hypothetical protein BCON_0096g00040 [Botryotinia convoluta]|uniref:FAD-binding domain-containing protein n=1 Tax=Botryotinia convoluta TaxID=54673 RepID=A0A4Z1I0Y3_9HELO|nr:hypothetical protein BCON_0096g00040 [Botryotinia convoluta]
MKKGVANKTPETGSGIAIVGGGIAGITLALGLVNRGISCKIHERGHIFSEIGAGVTFAPNSICAIEACDPSVSTAFKAVATHDLWKSNCANVFEGRKELYFDFSGGYHDNGSEPSKLLFSIYDWESSNSRVVDESDDQGLVTLYFVDGNRATAEAAIGADGFKSHVRQSILGFENHEGHACYSYKCAYCGLIPMENAIAELGEDMAANTEMHLGLDGHVITLPVDRGETMNVVAFTRTKEGSTDPHRSTRAATEQDTLNELAGWSKNATPILSLLNEYVETWAIFDMLDHPAFTYAKERKVVIGDAAHAASPHHGSGAGFAIENFAALAEMLATPAVKHIRGCVQCFKHLTYAEVLECSGLWPVVDPTDGQMSGKLRVLE